MHNMLSKMQPIARNRAIMERLPETQRHHFLNLVPEAAQHVVDGVHRMGHARVDARIEGPPRLRTLWVGWTAFVGHGQAPWNGDAHCVRLLTTLDMPRRRQPRGSGRESTWASPPMTSYKKALR